MKKLSELKENEWVFVQTIREGLRIGINPLLIQEEPFLYNEHLKTATNQDSVFYALQISGVAEIGIILSNEIDDYVIEVRKPERRIIGEDPVFDEELNIYMDYLENKVKELEVICEKK